MARPQTGPGLVAPVGQPQRATHRPGCFGPGHQPLGDLRGITGQCCSGPWQATTCGPMVYAHSRCTSGPGHKHVPGALQHCPNGQCTAMATNVIQCSPAWASLDACPRGKAPGQQHQVGPVPTPPRARLTEAVRSTQERAEQSAACAPKASQENRGFSSRQLQCKTARREKHTRMCEK